MLLREYEAARKAENLGVTAMCDVLKRVFSTDVDGTARRGGVGSLPLPLLDALRNAGMGVLNEAAPVKRLLARFAMGAKLF